MDRKMLIIGMGMGVLAFIFLMVGLATGGWAKSDDGGVAVGLFQVCGPRTCYTNDLEGAVAATKAFICIGFLLGFAAMVVTDVYYLKYVKKDVQNRNLPLIAAVLFFAAAGLTLLGCIIFGSKGLEDLTAVAVILFRRSTLKVGYSLGLSVVGGLFSIAAGVLVLVDRQTQPVS